MNSSMIYHGFVNIKLKIKDKILNVRKHNNGTDFLKKELAKILCGYSSNFVRPTYLTLKKFDSVSNTWEEFLITYQSVSGGNYYSVTQNGVTNWVATFTASIPYAQFKESIDPTAQYRLYMLSKLDPSTSEYHELMYVAMDAETLQTVVEGTSAIIEWQMSIVNPQE